VRRAPAPRLRLRPRRRRHRRHARLRAAHRLAERPVAHRQGLLRSQRLRQPRLRRLRHRGGAAMIVLLRAGASRVETRAVEAELARAGASARTVRGSGRVAVEVVGPHAPLDDAAVARIAALDAVESILDADEPNPRVAAARGPVTIDTPVGPLAVGGDEWTLMLGPCAVENEPDLVAAAA